MFRVALGALLACVIIVWVHEPFFSFGIIEPAIVGPMTIIKRILFAEQINKEISRTIKYRSVMERPPNIQGIKTIPRSFSKVPPSPPISLGENHMGWHLGERQNSSSGQIKVSSFLFGRHLQPINLYSSFPALDKERPSNVISWGLPSIFNGKPEIGWIGKGMVNFYNAKVGPQLPFLSFFHLPYSAPAEKSDSARSHEECNSEISNSSRILYDGRVFIALIIIILAFSIWDVGGTIIDKGWPVVGFALIVFGCITFLSGEFFAIGQGFFGWWCWLGSIF